MLVLSRKASEQILIGDNITIEVRRVAGNRVTLAIDAPRDIRILRGELERVAKEFEEEPTATESATEEPKTETIDVSQHQISLTAALMPPTQPNAAAG